MIFESLANTLIIISGYFDRRITEKRQEEETWIENTFIFKEKEREEEGDSLSSLNCSSPPIHNIYPPYYPTARFRQHFSVFLPLLSTIICTAITILSTLKI